MTINKNMIFVDEFNEDSNIKSNIKMNKEALMELYLKQICINNELGDKYNYNELLFLAHT
jgi:hypothetical protein